MANGAGGDRSAGGAGGSGGGWGGGRGGWGRRTERRTPQVDRAAQDLISDRDPKFDLTQQCKQSFPIIVVFPDPSMINKLIDCSSPVSAGLIFKSEHYA